MLGKVADSWACVCVCGGGGGGGGRVGGGLRGRGGGGEKVLLTILCLSSRFELLCGCLAASAVPSVGPISCLSTFVVVVVVQVACLSTIIDFSVACLSTVVNFSVDRLSTTINSSVFNYYFLSTFFSLFCCLLSYIFFLLPFLL